MNARAATGRRALDNILTFFWIALNFFAAFFVLESETESSGLELGSGPYRRGFNREFS
jgi:hypothetical protein